MPTINQLVRKPRTRKKNKRKHLALAMNFNPLKNKYDLANNPLREGYVYKLKL